MGVALENSLLHFPSSYCPVVGVNSKYSNISTTLCDTYYCTEHTVQVPSENHLWPVD